MFVASLPCFKCNKPFSSQAAHMDEVMQKTIASKACDSQVIPLCADSPSGKGCHSKRDQHLEIDYWEKNNNRAIRTAKKLYEVSGDSMEALRVLCNL